MHFLFLDVRTLNVKECHVVLPFVIENFIMKSVTFISLPTQVRTTLIFPQNKDHTYLGEIFIAFAPMTSYLKDLIQSIGRYGGYSWHETRFKGFLMHK